MLPKEENKKNVRQTKIEEVIAENFLDLNKKQLRSHGPELRHVVTPNQELPSRNQDLLMNWVIITPSYIRGRDPPPK